MKTIFPSKLIVNPAAMRRAINNGLDATAKAATVDFKVTTQTWEHQPSFSTSSPDEFTRVVGTDDKIYGYVNDGTRPHTIAPKGANALAFNANSRAKTRPNAIGSTAGNRGRATVIRRGVVHHPGTTARNFADVIAKKWQQQMAPIMQRAVDSEV